MEQVVVEGKKWVGVENNVRVVNPTRVGDCRYGAEPHSAIISLEGRSSLNPPPLRRWCVVRDHRRRTEKNQKNGPGIEPATLRSEPTFHDHRATSSTADH